MKKNALYWIGMILLIIGGLNWGFFGLFNFNLVEWIFGTGAFATVIYTLVGISGLYGIFLVSK